MRGLAVARYSFATILLIAIMVQFVYLIRYVSTPGADAPFAALLGSIVTATTGAFGLIVKDLFNPNDAVGGNGYEKPPADK